VVEAGGTVEGKDGVGWGGPEFGLELGFSAEVW